MPYDLITPGILNLSNGTFNSAPTQENLMPIELRGLCPVLEVFAKPTWVRFCRVFPGSALIENAPRGPGEFGWGLFRSAQGTPIMLNSAYDSGERPEVSDPARITAHLDTGRRLRQSRSRRRLPGHPCERGLNIQPPKFAWDGIKQLPIKDPDGFGFQSKADPLKSIEGSMQPFPCGTTTTARPEIESRLHGDCVSARHDRKYLR